MAVMGVGMQKGKESSWDRRDLLLRSLGQGEFVVIISLQLNTDTSKKNNRSPFIIKEQGTAEIANSAVPEETRGFSDGCVHASTRASTNTQMNTHTHTHTLFFSLQTQNSCMH